MKKILLTLLLLGACTTKTINVPGPETFDQMLLRTEGVQCSDLTAHDPSAPAPDCTKVYNALSRGRARMIAKFPAATSIKLSQVTVYMPKLFWATSSNCSTYPCFDRLGGYGAAPIYDRGVTTPGIGQPFIQYAYEEVLEHEMCHAIMMIIGPDVMRTPEAVAADPGEEPYDGPPMTYIFQITCHNTPDDPVGDGPVGSRSGCVLPYSGPPNPLVIQ